jgi:hypothetical protein
MWIPAALVLTFVGIALFAAAGGVTTQIATHSLRPALASSTLTPCIKAQPRSVADRLQLCLPCSTGLSLVPSAD